MATENKLKLGMDGNEVFKMLSGMTEQERGQCLFAGFLNGRNLGYIHRELNNWQLEPELDNDDRGEFNRLSDAEVAALAKDMTNTDEVKAAYCGFVADWMKSLVNGVKNWAKRKAGKEVEEKTEPPMTDTWTLKDLVYVSKNDENEVSLWVNSDIPNVHDKLYRLGCFFGDEFEFRVEKAVKKPNEPLSYVMRVYYPEAGDSSFVNYNTWVWTPENRDGCAALTERKSDMIIDCIEKGFGISLVK